MKTGLPIFWICCAHPSRSPFPTLLCTPGNRPLFTEAVRLPCPQISGQVWLRQWVLARDKRVGRQKSVGMFTPLLPFLPGPQLLWKGTSLATVAQSLSVLLYLPHPVLLPGWQQVRTVCSCKTGALALPSRFPLNSVTPL